MLFPQLKRLATTEVICLQDTASVQAALQLMQKHRLRAVIIESERGYRLLTAKDMVNFHLQGMDFNVPLYQVHLPPALQLAVDASVEEAIRQISLNQTEQVCLIDDAGQLQGIVSYTDLVRSLDPELLAETQSLGELLRGVQVLQVNREMPAQLAFSLMQQQQVSTLLVSEESIPLGILTQTDIIRLLEAGTQLNQPVEALMSSPVFTLPANLSIQQALVTIRDKGFKRLVVTDKEGRVVGLISQQDLVSIYYNQWFGLLKQQQEELTRANKELRQQNQLLALVLNEVSHALLVVKGSGRVLFGNAAAEKLLNHHGHQLEKNHLKNSHLENNHLEQLFASSSAPAELETFCQSLRLGLPAQLSCSLAPQDAKLLLKARPLLGDEEPLTLLHLILQEQLPVRKLA